jgi:hypothetical protein
MAEWAGLGDSNGRVVSAEIIPVVTEAVSGGP